MSKILELVYDTTLAFYDDPKGVILASISLPFYGAKDKLTVNWGDGTTDNKITHQYKVQKESTVITVQTSAGAGYYSFGTLEDPSNLEQPAPNSYAITGLDCLTKINFIDPVYFKTLKYGFAFAPSLVSAPTSLSFKNNIDISYLFYKDYSFETNVSTWNVSSIKFGNDKSTYINNMFSETVLDSSTIGNIINKWTGNDSSSSPSAPDSPSSPEVPDAPQATDRQGGNNTIRYIKIGVSVLIILYCLLMLFYQFGSKVSNKTVSTPDTYEAPRVNTPNTPNTNIPNIQSASNITDLNQRPNRNIRRRNY